MDKLYKLIVIGDSEVGKSSFVMRILGHDFKNTYRATLGVDFAIKRVKLSPEMIVKLQLWDIAGQERFTSMTRVYYKNTHACIIMFDLTRRNTYLNALNWKKDLDSKCTLSDGTPVPCILLANKCDLADIREVTQDEIEAFCKEQEFTGWTEISVKDNLMVEESLRYLVEEVLNRSDRDYGIFNNNVSPTPLVLRSDQEEFVENNKCFC